MDAETTDRAETAEDRSEPLIPPYGDEKVGGKVQNLFDAAYRDNLPFQGSQMEWLAFHEGQQYVRYNADQNKLMPDKKVPPWRVRHTENRIRPTIDRVVSIMAAERPRLAARPGSPDFEDRNTAEVATAILAYLGEHLSFADYDRLLKKWKCIHGHAALEIEWDKDAGQYLAVPELNMATGKFEPKKKPCSTCNPADLDPECAECDGTGKGETVYKAEGDFVLGLRTALEILFDPASSSIDDAEWVTTFHEMDAKEAERRFGVKAKTDNATRPRGEGSTSGIKGRVGWILRRVRSLFGPKRGGLQDSWGSQTSGGVDVLKFYLAPCPDYPGGRMIVMIGSEVVYDDVSPVRGAFRFPIVMFHHRKHGKRPGGDGIVQDLIDVQREWNKFKSWIMEYRDLQMKGKILSPREAEIDEDAFTTEHGEVIEWSASSSPVPPQIWTPQNLPSSVFTALSELKEAFDFISGIYDATRGSTPQGAGGSGKAMAFSKEQSTERLQTVIRQDFESWARVGSILLYLCGQHWDDGKKIRTIGRDFEPMLVDFNKANFSTPMDVVVENDDALPSDRTTRMNLLSQMFQAGGIMDPARPTEQRRYFLGLARMADVRGLLDNENRDEARARRQFRYCLQNIPQQAAYFDDHATHRRVLLGLMKTVDFENSPDEAKALVFQLDAEHATYLMGTTPMDTQGNPLPPGSMTPDQMMQAGAAMQAQKPQGSPPAVQMTPK